MSTEEDKVSVWKRQLTALENDIAKVSEVAAEATADPVEMEIHIEVLQSLYEQASNIILKLEGETGPSKRRETLTFAYVKAKSELTRIIRQNAEPPPGLSRAPALDQTMAPGVSSRPDRLPRLELPTFNGAATEWQAFKTRFEKLTISEDADKYGFLHKCLAYEPARNTAAALENSGLPFAAAWAKLEERFYKQRVAFEGYFFNVLKMRRMQRPSQRAILGLIDAVDTMVSATRQIANEQPSENCVSNGLLICIVKERLDAETLSTLERHLDLHKIFTWEEFKAELEQIANQISCKEAAEAAHSQKPNATRSMAAASAKPEANQEKAKVERRCHYCKRAGHYIAACPIFTQLGVKERYESLKIGKNCYNCLGSGHGVQTCKSEKRCRKCKGKHHTMLHNEEAPPTEPKTGGSKERDAAHEQASTSKAK